MDQNNIIVREYLESLKEDGELDYLFPILLNLMGFRIKATPRSSKGMPQYGKDVVAVGLNAKGIKSRYYFELKGHADKDIDDTSFLKKDGIRESILAAKDTPYTDSADPEFNALPIEIVLVHNGILKSNTRQTFEGFITREFPNGGFSRWDIYDLSDLFGKYLFSEYLLTDEHSIRLFKRTLILLDAPENDFSDFKELVELQIQKITTIKGRALKKLFATLNLLSIVVLHYSKESNNLYPARECLTFLVLRLWAWILKNKLENNSAILKGFRKILKVHYEMLDGYFEKTINAALIEDGLYVEASGTYEAIGYPIRCFDYLGYLIYYFNARQYFPQFEFGVPVQKQIKLAEIQKAALMNLISKNDGCYRPLVDNHSIPLLAVLLFFLKQPNLTAEEELFVGTYVVGVLENILLIKATRGRFPELKNNLKALTEYAATKERPDHYQDKSTLLITTLFELLVLFDAKDIYDQFVTGFRNKINLQVAFCDFKKYDIEQLLFEGQLDDEFAVEASIDLPTDFETFKTTTIGKSRETLDYRTDKVGFAYLRLLAHHYYKTELFPYEWRSLMAEPPQS